MSIYENNRVDLSKANSSPALIYSHVKRGQSVLDLGCSSGNMAKALSTTKDCTVYGVEIDHDDAEAARSYCAKVIEVDIDEYDFKDFAERSFDSIIIQNVLEHLVKPERALNKIKKLMKDDGRVIFSVPNVANITTRLDLLSGNFDPEESGILDATHLHFYTRNSIQKLFHSSGYSVDSIEASWLDLPDKVISKTLAEIGITMSDKLKGKLEESDAFAYEIIGVARLGHNGGTELNYQNKIELESKAYVSKLEDDIHELKQVILKLEKNNKDLAKKSMDK